MSALDPSGPSQPTQSQAYTTPGNPSTKNPSERAQSVQNSLDDSPAVDQRIPQEQSTGGGQPSSLGRGIHGAPAGEEAKGLTEEDVGRHQELDGEQMAAPGEGKVADAVAGRGKSMGGGGEQPDLAADLDRKKAEQAEAREAMQEQRGADSKMGGALGQSGGPANPVDSGNYPNSGVQD